MGAGSLTVTMSKISHQSHITNRIGASGSSTRAERNRGDWIKSERIGSAQLADSSQVSDRLGASENCQEASLGRLLLFEAAAAAAADDDNRLPLGTFVGQAVVSL